MNYKTKLSGIKLFAFDYDGVFTNGTVYLMPDGSMARTASARDGFAVQWAVKQGLNLAVVSGGKDEPVRWRMEKLGLTEVHLGADDKLAKLQEISDRTGIALGDMAYMGDDMPDIPALEAVGLSCCPNDAAFDVLPVCDHVSDLPGGKGCVRELIEAHMKANGIWQGEGLVNW